ncbi:MAG: ATP-binding protein [Pseudohongiellaceae bacterium]
MDTPIIRHELRHLEAWYRREGRKPLIIQGARQVGKSTLVRQFASQNDLQLLEINFERNPEFRQAFEANDPASILTTLQLLTGSEFTPPNAILFLDEIQAAPEAIAALRYFYEERPDIPVLAAGSLLEFTLSNAQFSMPVGRVEYMYMGPIAFADFLLAVGEGGLARHLVEMTLADIEKKSMPAAIHNKLMTLFRQYCVVGGMPEAVARYVTHRSYAEVLRVQSSVLATYRDDFNKYSHGAMTRRVQLVFDRAPTLVGNKFKYVHVSRDHRAAELKDALSQLCMARVLTRVHHSSANGVPLGAVQKGNIFKVLFMDVGLLCSVLGINELNIQQDGPHLVNKGAVAEQFIGQHLLYTEDYYQSPALFYWTREAKSAAAEVDYLLPIDRQIIPVEIKAGATGALRSLHQFCQEKQGSYALRFNAEPPSVLKSATATTAAGKVTYNLLSLPLYMVGETKRLVKELLVI